MSAYNFRLGLVLLLLCHCSLEPQEIAPDAASIADAAPFADASSPADMSKSADMSTPPRPTPRIITRKWLTEDGGALDLADRFYDTKLGEQCFFLLDSEGKTRCLPYDFDDQRLSVQFSDSSCTQPIAVVTTPLCTAHRYRYFVRSMLDPKCNTQYVYKPYVIGPELSPRGVWTSSPLGCKAGTTGVLFYSLEAAPLTDFVAAELK